MLSIGLLAMFLRFVVGADLENAARLTGVITEAEMLRREGAFFRHEEKWLEETFAWFNEHLPCPPFQDNLRRGRWTRDAVCWFRSDAGEPLRRIWDIIALLRDVGMQVRMVTTKNPGKVVYNDAYQVVAETPYWA